MGKRAFTVVYGLLSLVLVCFLGGCADAEILTEIPETASQEIEAAEEATEEATKEAKSETVIPDILYDGASCFAYYSLNEAEQIWYQNIAESLGTMQESCKLDKAGIDGGLDETDIDRIFQCVLTDHPELFYVEGYTYTKYTRGDKIVSIEFSGTFSMDAEQMLLRKEEIDNAVQILLDGAAGLKDDYDKVKYVYDTLIYNTEYDLNAPENQNIYSVFVNHVSVCQGYAKAVQYLLERMGVECTLVQGSVDTGENHAWNLVKVNGSYYYVDATWGDASYMPNENGMSEGYVPEINYDYLCVTTEQLLRTHILGSYVPMPACVDEKDNYYVREGALFTTYDKEQMKELFDAFLAENRKDVTLKCADAECYNRILQTLVAEQEIFDYLDENSDTIAYTQNEKQLSMTFWVTNE